MLKTMTTKCFVKRQKARWKLCKLQVETYPTKLLSLRPSFHTRVLTKWSMQMPTQKTSLFACDRGPDQSAPVFLPRIARWATAGRSTGESRARASNTDTISGMITAIAINTKASVHDLDIRSTVRQLSAVPSVLTNVPDRLGSTNSPTKSGIADWIEARI